MEMLSLLGYRPTAPELSRKGVTMKKETCDVIYPQPLPEDVHLERNVYATMRDGVKIALDIYSPANGKGPWPAIFAYSPFQKERFFERKAFLWFT